MNATVAPVAMIEVSLVVFVQQDVQAVVVKVVFISKMKPISNLLFLFKDDICVLYPCSNSGQCVPEGGSRRCVCVTPYYGDDCREGKAKINFQMTTKFSR
jgi:hypothetical protein